MAHLVETMAYSGETPWHGLGAEVSNDLTPNQMLKAAGLDWDVFKVQQGYYLKVPSERDPTKTVPKYFKSDDWALIRSSDNKKLSACSENWEPLQNAEAFEFFSDFVSQGKMEMHTAGALKGGKMVWGLAKLPNEGFELAGGDKITGHLLFSNPHEFGKAITVMFTPIRVVCNNTLTMALDGRRSAVKVSVNHRRAFDAQAVKEALGLADKRMDEFRQYAEFLQGRRYTQDQLTEFLAQVFPKTKSEKSVVVDSPQTAALEEAIGMTARDQLSRNAVEGLKLIDLQPGADIAPGSWWNAFNVVTFMTDHIIGRSDDSRLHSAWFGPNHNTKIEALKLAAQMAA